MPLSDIIAEIISRAKVDEICDALHNIQVATTETEFIEASLELVVFGYQAGYINDTDLASLTESLLNTYFIYTNGTFTVADPTEEVYLLKNVVVNITLNTVTKVRINAMGGSTLNLTANNQSYANVKSYDTASVNVTVNDMAMVNIEGKQNSVATIQANSASVCHITGHDFMNVNYTGNSTSYGLAKMFQNSTLSYILNDTAIMNAKVYQQAQTILS